MATLLQAISAYGPKIETNKTVGLEETAKWIAMRTSINPSQASAMLQELNACVLCFNQQGPLRSGMRNILPIPWRFSRFRSRPRMPSPWE